MLNHKKEMQKQIDQLNKHMELIDYKIWYYETADEAGTKTIHKKMMEKQVDSFLKAPLNKGAFVFLKNF